MNAADVLTARSITSGSTSYWSPPEKTLDPELFTGTRIRPQIRTGLLSLLYGFWARTYRNAESWSDVWIAGSGASYQWAAARNPGDLDILIGVDYSRFRKANPSYAGLSDTEISAHMNDEFRDGLDHTTANWNGYETTWYVNPGATDIRAIRPYAAFCLTHNEWTVPPDPAMHAPSSTEWDQKAQGDLTQARDILDRYNRAHALLTTVTDPGHRLNAAQDLKHALDSGAKLFDEIHEGRHAAFDEDGQGYSDWANARWQFSKKTGINPVLRALKQERAELYGEVPESADKQLIKAALWRRGR